jgi:arylsulfatase A-like enzyme
VMSGGVDYFTHRDSAGVHDLCEGETEVHRAGYLTDLITDRAVEFVGRQKKANPFLLSVHYTAPHWPWEAREDEAVAASLERIVHTDGGSVETYLRMIHHMDEGIGRILGALRVAGAGENTIVVFTSDNGGERFSDTWPLVGKKMDLLEGGIRVPCLVRWPARVAGGTTTAQLAMTMDWMPTFLEAAGVAPHAGYPLDGLSLLPVLKDPKVRIERDLFWRMKFRGQRAMRSGDWKYFVNDDGEFLFDLSRDLRERANLARGEAGRLASMRERFAAWDKSMPPIPEAAKYSIPYTRADLAHPS